jgi:phosphodiesterase/alkaline phosphatase D-like protein
LPAVIADTYVQIAGSVLQNGNSVTVWFESGTSPTLEQFATSARSGLHPGASDGSDNFLQTGNLSGLRPGTTYYYRFAAGTPEGKVYRGKIIGVTTRPTDVAPLVEGLPPSAVTATTAVLHGTVNVRGEPDGGVRFAVGTSPETGSMVPAEPALILVSGRSDQAVSATASNLRPGTTYYVRLYAHSYGGYRDSNIVSFTTPIR